MFLHTFHPSQLLIDLGCVKIYTYGFLIAMSILFAYLLIFFLAKKYQQWQEKNLTIHLDNLFIWQVVFAIIGARIFFVIYNLDYFKINPSEIIAVWHGGWVWHGALVGGLLTLLVYVWAISRKNSWTFFRLFWTLADVLAPGIALGQAIGRWGNYFNQEAYGLPFNSSIAIPIDLEKRVFGFENFQYFHPTFLYESAADFFIALVTATIFIKVYKNKGNKHYVGLVFAFYLLVYSLARFFIELIRIDSVPVIWGLRAPQWISILLIIVALTVITKKFFWPRRDKEQ